MIKVIVIAIKNLFASDFKKFIVDFLDIMNPIIIMLIIMIMIIHLSIWLKIMLDIISFMVSFMMILDFNFGCFGYFPLIFKFHT